MAGLSPEDYRRAAGYRRNEATGPGIGHNGGPALVDRAGPVSAWIDMSLTSPEMEEFVRGGRMSAAGIAVNDRSAFRNSSFFRATNLIASSIGMLPTQLHRRLADGTTEKAKDHPLYRVLHKRPNPYQTAFEFKSYMQSVALCDGNAYARAVWGVRGGVKTVIALIPFERRSIEPKLSDNWELTFDYTNPKGGKKTLAANEVFHFRHPLSRDGLKGIGLLDVIVETIGVASAAERAAGKLFDKGVMAGGALETKDSLGEETIGRLKESLREDHAGAENAGDWLILEEGLTAKPFVSNARDAQHVEMRKFSTEDLARFTDIPRPLLMMDETSWGTGIRELGLFLVTYCLTKWFVAWEQAFERTCLTQAEQDADELYIKFNDGALLRGSLKEQAEFFSKALGNNAAWMEPNEVRANFELNPVADGNGLPKPAEKSPSKSKDDDADD
ncbi:phage portal protein [Rhizorhabdus histidinilytica]|uniref:phage portal protein n=1 Tax=Rhizorhabdus histidinilytica TaxID=439228 RepID=UPI00321FA117